MKNSRIYLWGIVTVLAFILFGSLGIIVGFLVGYYKRSIVFAMLISVALSVLMVGLAILSNLGGFLVSLLLGGTGSLSSLLFVSVIFGAVFGAMGWFFGKQASGR